MPRSRNNHHPVRHLPIKPNRLTNQGGGGGGKGGLKMLVIWKSINATRRKKFLSSPGTRYASAIKTVSEVVAALLSSPSLSSSHPSSTSLSRECYVTGSMRARYFGWLMACVWRWKCKNKWIIVIGGGPPFLIVFQTRVFSRTRYAWSILRRCGKTEGADIFYFIFAYILCSNCFMTFCLTALCKLPLVNWFLDASCGLSVRSLNKIRVMFRF